MRTHLLSLATRTQGLRSFFEALRLDDIAFCKLERLKCQKTVPYRCGSDVPISWPELLGISSNS